MKKLLNVIGPYSLTRTLFAIRREKKVNGEEILVPVCKEQGLFSSWTPIVRIYERYYAVNMETDHVFTEQECLDHIEGYKYQLREMEGQKVSEVVYESLI